MEIGDWLRNLGLDKYEAAFRDNEIDDAVLPTLTAEDLKDLGVDIVGHRRKLLNAIALLRGDTATKPPSPEAPQTQPKAAQESAERRQVTVMFSDLVGSTALSARMDPEDLREVISAYHKCVAKTVQRFDELANPFAHTALDRIKPVVEKVGGSVGCRLERIRLRGTVRHGMVSVPALERRVIRG